MAAAAQRRQGFDEKAQLELLQRGYERRAAAACASRLLRLTRAERVDSAREAPD